MDPCVVDSFVSLTFRGVIQIRDASSDGRKLYDLVLICAGQLPLPLNKNLYPSIDHARRAVRKLDPHNQRIASFKEYPLFQGTSPLGQLVVSDRKTPSYNQPIQARHVQVGSRLTPFAASIFVAWRGTNLIDEKFTLVRRR